MEKQELEKEYTQADVQQKVDEALDQFKASFNFSSLFVDTPESNIGKILAFVNTGLLVIILIATLV